MQYIPEEIHFKCLSLLLRFQAIMGLIAAYILFEYFKNGLKQVNAIGLYLSLLTLPLIKSSGVFLSISIAVIVAIDYLGNQDETRVIRYDKPE